MACEMENKSMVEVVKVDITEEPLKTLHVLYQMQQDQQFTDVVLIAKESGMKVPVHRNILSARCDYFRTMFLSEMIESKQEEIYLSEISGEDLKNIIKYIYTGNIELSESNVETLVAAAHLYQLANVVSTCSQFLERNIHYSNCLGFWAIAELHEMTNLITAAQTYAYKNFDEVCKSEEFLKLDDTRLRKLLASDEIFVGKEETVFESIIVWVEHKKVERRKYISDLLPLVRVGSLSPSFIMDQKQLILKTINDLQLLGEIMNWYLTADDSRRATVGETLLALITNYGDENTPIQKYNSSDISEWKIWKKRDDRRINFGVTIMYDDLIVAGGVLNNDFDDNEAVSIVTSLNTKTMRVKTLNPMRTNRMHLSLVVLGDFVYAIGGYANSNSLKNVERWNRKTGLWTNVALMNEGRYGQVAAVLNGYIYVAGGNTKSTECYNPNTNSWVTRAPMRDKRKFSGVAVLKNYLYVVGGEFIKSVERYDHLTNTWTMVCSLNSERYGHGCIAFNNSLIVAGGTCFGTYYDVEEYDSIADVWTQKCSLPVSGHCILVKVGNNIV